MAHFHRVQVLHAVNDLMKKTACFQLGQALVGYNVIKHFASIRKFHNEKNSCGGVENFKKLHDVFVAVTLENLNFAGHPFNICDLYNTILLENFDGHFFAREDVCAELYFSKRPFSQCFAQEVMADGTCKICAWGRCSVLIIANRRIPKQELTFVGSYEFCYCHFRGFHGPGNFLSLLLP